MSFIQKVFLFEFWDLCLQKLGCFWCIGETTTTHYYDICCWLSSCKIGLSHNNISRLECLAALVPAMFPSSRLCASRAESPGILSPCLSRGGEVLPLMPAPEETTRLESFDWTLAHERRQFTQAQKTRHKDSFDFLDHSTLWWALLCLMLGRNWRRVLLEIIKILFFIFTTKIQKPNCEFSRKVLMILVLKMCRNQEMKNKNGFWIFHIYLALVHMMRSGRDSIGRGLIRASCHRGRVCGRCRDLGQAGSVMALMWCAWWKFEWTWAGGDAGRPSGRKRCEASQFDSDLRKLVAEDRTCLLRFSNHTL